LQSCFLSAYFTGFEIFRLDGSHIFQSEYFSNEVKLSTSEFEKGVYILQIKTSSGIANRKLVIDLRFSI